MIVLVSAAVSDRVAEKSSSLVEGRVLAGLDGMVNISFTWCSGAGRLKGQDKLKDGRTAKAMAGPDAGDVDGDVGAVGGEL